MEHPASLCVPTTPLECAEARSPGRETPRGYAAYTRTRWLVREDESVPSKEILVQTPDVSHALVHTRPTSGAKRLYLAPTTMVGIEGMDEANAGRCSTN